ncbi:hypothetical protein GCM10025866_34380 [Naasia aerilata]|uniref:Uncharacterized protein n=1 Tax=Naasia aerilata TaxID=1162966 RepID=A0ABM8GGP4_9MICO|nr:hypothetical protein GCM10025866_34380 [Naasia aerilata]
MHPAVLHRDQDVGVAGCEVQIVQDDHDGRAALPVEVGEQVEHLDLVREVEERRRLVEQEDVGLLGERHGDPHALPLAAGQLVDRAVREGQGVGVPQRAGDSGVIGAAPPPEPALVRVPPAAHQVGDGDALGRDRGLGEEAEDLRHLARRDVGERAPVEQDPAVAGRQEACHGAQQRRLAGGVGPDDSGDAALGDIEAEVGEDGAVVVRDGHPVDGQRVGHRLPPVRLVLERSHSR